MKIHLHLIYELWTYITKGYIVQHGSARPGRYEDYEAWETIRQEVLARDQYTCQKCGGQNLRLDAHHIKPKWKGGTDTEEKLTALCTDCHREAHRTDGTKEHAQAVIQKNKKPHLTFCQCGCRKIFVAQDPRQKYKTGHKKAK